MLILVVVLALPPTYLAGGYFVVALLAWIQGKVEA